VLEELRPVRAFIAIAVPGSVLRSCEEIIAQLRKLDLQGRFAKTGSIHLTLQFLGNIEKDQIAPIGQVLEQAGSGVDPFDLEVGQLGVFPHLAHPRVVWIGVEAVDGLMALHSKIQEGLEPLGFPPENRDFHPHLTLLRLKSRRNLGGLSEYLQAEGPRQRAGVIQVGEIHLYQSILKRQGAEYQKLLTFVLGD
jgi:2'-5' RNA ligase